MQERRVALVKMLARTGVPSTQLCPSTSSKQRGTGTALENSHRPQGNNIDISILDYVPFVNFYNSLMAKLKRFPVKKNIIF